MLKGLSAFGRQLYGDLVDNVIARAHPFDLLATFQNFFPNYSQTLFNRDFNVVSNFVDRMNNAQRLKDSVTIRASMYSKRDFPYQNAQYGHVVSFTYTNNQTGATSTRYRTVTSNIRQSKEDVYNAIASGQVGGASGGTVSDFKLVGAYKS